MSALIEMAKIAWAEEQQAIRQAEEDLQAELREYATILMEGLVSSRLANYAPRPVDFPKPKLQSVIDLGEGSFECSFTIDGWWFKATSIDDTRRLYLYGPGEPEIFRLADLGRILEERGWLA